MRYTKNRRLPVYQSEGIDIKPHILSDILKECLTETDIELFGDAVFTLEYFDFDVYILKVKGYNPAMKGIRDSFIAIAKRCAERMTGLTPSLPSRHNLEFRVLPSTFRYISADMESHPMYGSFGRKDGAYVRIYLEIKEDWK